MWTVATTEARAWLVGMGVTCAIGDGVEQAWTSFRAGISRYRESSIQSKRLTPLVMALLPEENLAPEHEAMTGRNLPSRRRRMVRLASAALAEAVGGLPAADVRESPLFLALPEPADPTSSSAASFLDDLGRSTERGFAVETSRCFESGRGAGLEALAAALDWLDGKKNATALVGGVDTYLDLSLLARLDLEDRLLTEGATDGFAPGEGACFLALSTSSSRARHGGIAAVALDREDGCRGAGSLPSGDALARAVSNVVSTLDTDQRVDRIWCSLNGESFSAKEWGVAYLRNSKAFVTEYRFEHPADCYGDVGAASGTLLVALAARELDEDGSGPTLVWCASDGPLRAAALIVPGAR